MSLVCDLAPAYIKSIAPYQAGKPIGEVAREIGIPESAIVKLASNENPLGPSPKAIAAMQAILPDLALYPDGNGFVLKAAIARRFAVPESHIVLGNGSNDILELAARTFLSPGTSAVFSRHAFAVYPLVTIATGATAIEVPARDFGNDLPALAAAVRPDTRIVFLANPNNPTGTFIAPEAIRQWLLSLPAHVLVVLDEAYGEYLAPTEAGNTPAWLSQHRNLLISRTLSKAYGLAGLRVGFGMADAAIIDLMNRVRQPFNVNALAQAAAAAALFDDEFIALSRAVNSAGLKQLTAAFQRRGLSYIPSWGNFIAVNVGAADALFKALLARGVIVRPVAGYGMPEYLRISIGTEAQNARFLDALDEATAALARTS
jgi:histidinol-phosphate aminotransferase